MSDMLAMTLARASFCNANPSNKQATQANAIRAAVHSYCSAAPVTLSNA